MNNLERQKILIFGRSGQVGYELRRTLATLGNVCAIDVAECDLTDKDSIIKTLDSYRPAVIANAAAYTAVDKAESDRTVARLLNADAPGTMAEWAAKNNACLIHYSTDYVFDGTKETPWTEEDIPNPLNVYGETKLGGDENIRASGCMHFIFRTSWVYGARGKNFLLTMKRLLSEREEVRVVNDQHGAPTWSRTIAEVTAQVLCQVKSPLFKADTHKLSGIYNLTNSGETTWYDFTLAIRKEMLKRDPNAHLARVTSIPSSEYPAAAKRPEHSALSGEKLYRTFGIMAQTWDEALAEVCGN